MNAKFLLLLALHPIGFLAAQEAAAPAARLAWETGVDAAFKKAREGNRPLLFVIMKDEEIACRRMLADVWTDPRVIEKAASFVLLPASIYMHEPLVVTEEGRETRTCPQFPGVSCAEHQAIEKEMHVRYFDRPEIVAPQHLFCDGDGRVLERKEYELKVEGLLELMDAVLRKHRGEPAPAAAGEGPAAAPPEGDAAAKLSAEAEALLREVATGPLEARKDAAQKLLGEAEKERARALVDLLLDPKVFKSEKDVAEVVRVLGYPRFSHAAPEVCRLLDSRAAAVRNAAVVTLEEMENGDAAPALLELWKREKDAEIKKDVLRALGPAGGRSAEALDVLRKNLAASEDRRREAAAMSLGYWLATDVSVRAELKARYRKETGKGHVKAAILYGYRTAGDAALAADIKEMQREERNADFLNLGEIVAATLEGRAPDVDLRRGGRRGGGGPGGGAMMLFFRMVGPLFEDDRVPRHRVTEILERFRNRGEGGRDR